MNTDQAKQMIDVFDPDAGGARKKVSDPALLEKLNAPEPKKVTDPAILAKLNGTALVTPKEAPTDPIRTAYRDVANTLYEGINDVGGAIGEGLSYVTPQPVKDLASVPIENLKNSSEGQFAKILSDLAKSEVKDLSQYNTNLKPDLQAFGKNVRAVTNLPIVKPMAESIPSVAKFDKNIMEDLKPEPIMSHEEIKDISTQKYQQAAALGGILKPEVTDKWLTSLNDLIPKGEIAKELSQDRPFKQLIDRLQIAKGKPITLQDAQEIDELLGAAADGHFKPAGMTKEGQKILEIQSKFRDAITDAKESDMMGGAHGFKAWDDAKFYWSQSMKQRDIEKIIERASLTQNPTTAMKTGFKNLYTSAKNSRAYTDAEKAAIKNAAATGLMDEVMQLPASRLISIGRIAAGGGLGEAAAAKASSMAADSLRTAHQLGKANKISREISKSVQNRIAESKKTPPPMKLLPAPKTIYQAGKEGVVPTTEQQMKAGRFQSEFDKAQQQVAQKKLAKAPSNVQGITPEMIQAAQEKLVLQGKQPSEFGNILSQIFGGQAQ